ncbi:hypothetical protein CORC01_01511 [Colletotrichum orchidophilum]|uniref:AB hydrolase-1 domain-containing protein n=1 Tax=Colletotrichum orchidophilum TaxID=1209926 RepID=A0A1G4BP80_9PEZI|nr:uncharacterized protein CORC01_01511 [Colletotrichum orchidophilum]OHF03127.1 hypothetical protein CORC01_01511 [Colletotrichum orchidophilum]
MTTFEGFSPFTVTTQTSPDVVIHGIKSGDSSSSSSSPALPPLLLLHGYPQSHHIWHRVAAAVKDRYTVVAIDIRGYGASSKPEGVASYAKSAMARDCIAVMDSLGYNKSSSSGSGSGDGSFYVCAHDRGARVAHKLCVEFPDRIKKAIFLDICPTLVMYKTTDVDFAKAYFHWFFLIQPAPLPETLISAAPRRFMELLMGGGGGGGGRQTAARGGGLEVFERANFDYYAEVMAQPEAVRAMCDEYRASATLDLEEAEGDLGAGRVLKTPLLVLWGAHGYIARRFDAVGEWKKVAAEGVEAPDEVVKAIDEFFV